MAKQKHGKKARGRRASPLTPTTCPCGGGEYASCCGPLLSGEREADDPEALMRSRYSAYAVQDARYLYRTLHDAHEDRAQGEDAFCEALQTGFGQLRYAGLRVLDRGATDAHGGAQVLFLARVTQHRRDRSFVELSDFARDEDGGWRYLGGVTRPLAELGHDPGEMSIAHWQCGDHHH